MKSREYGLLATIGVIAALGAIALPASAQGRGYSRSGGDRAYAGRHVSDASQNIYHVNSLINAQRDAQDRGNWIDAAKLGRQIGDAQYGRESGRGYGRNTIDCDIDAAAQDLYRINSLKNARCAAQARGNWVEVATLNREIDATQCDMDRLHDRITR